MFVICFRLFYTSAWNNTTNKKILLPFVFSFSLERVPLFNGINSGCTGIGDIPIDIGINSTNSEIFVSRSCAGIWERRQTRIKWLYSDITFPFYDLPTVTKCKRMKACRGMSRWNERWWGDYYSFVPSLHKATLCWYDRTSKTFLLGLPKAISIMFLM